MAYGHPDHELRAEALARAAGFTQVSVSHRVSALCKFVPRGDTTLVDAYLSPILARYVDGLAAQMPGVRLLFMQSSGGLTDARRFHGKDAILSGPAGGILGMVRTAQSAGHDRLIGFDMGGTSTDVSHFAGEFERVFDTVVAGVRVRAPMMSIHTIAAGGGSTIRFDGARLRVGSAVRGRGPGPRELSARRPADRHRRESPARTNRRGVLPHGCSDRGRISRSTGTSSCGISRNLAQRMSSAAASTVSPERAAAGALEIAVGAMANAVKRISVARGYDVTRYTLQCFGGAGGQHACLVADALGMTRVFCHPLAGVMSAYGMGLADQAVMREATLERSLDAAGLAQARALAAAAGCRSRPGTRGAGRVGAIAAHRARALVRYAGTDTTLSCDLSTGADAGDGGVGAVRAQFERGYRERFSFLMPHRELVIEAVAIECIAGTRHELRRRARRLRLTSPNRGHGGPSIASRTRNPRAGVRRAGMSRMPCAPARASAAPPSSSPPIRRP